MALTTWAGNRTYRTDRVVHPTSLDEVRDVVASSRHVRALGSRHSFTDLADSPTLLSLDRLVGAGGTGTSGTGRVGDGRVDVDTAAGTVRVAGGIRHGELADPLHAAGLALHAMASLPHISVAGAVATATHGSGDRAGNLASAVVGLEMVTADGDLLTLGADDPRLPGAVVGLGALGVVTALTLAVEPTYDVAQEVLLDLPWDVAQGRFDEVTASADSVSLFTDWTSPAVGQVWRKHRTATGALPERADERFGARPADVPVHPVPGGDPASCTEQLGVAGPWFARLPHFRMEFTPSHGAELQSEYLLPRRHAPAALEAMRAIGHLLAPVLLISEVRTVAADPLWLSTAHGEDAVALHFTWRQDADGVAAVLPAVEGALEPFGPRPHWGKVFTAEGAGHPDRLRAVYPRFDEARALVAELDPEGCFANDFLRRAGLVG